MNLQCGHSTDCDLDTICLKCGRSFIPKPYIPYLIVVGVQLIFYYSRPTPFKDLLLPLFWIVSWFILTCILRNRRNELSKALMLIIPTMIIWAIIRGYSPIYIHGIERILFVISIIFISIPIIDSISVSFQDAVHMNTLNKGSFWIVISILASLGITLLYFAIPQIYRLIPFEGLKTLFANVYYYVGLIYKYRSAFVAIVLGLTTVISISTSFIKELKPLSLNNPNTTAENTDLTGIGFLLKKFLEAIGTAGDFARQILVTIYEEVLALFRDTVKITILIIIRLVRVTLIIVLAAFLLMVINKIVEFINVLWASGSFWSTSIGDWISFLLHSIIFSGLLWIISMITYRRWNEFIDRPLNFNGAFSLLFGSMREVSIAFKSITISTFMYLFYFSLTFLGSWLVINPVHYLFDINYPNPIGFLFIFSIVLIIVFGVFGRKIIFKDKYLVDLVDHFNQGVKNIRDKIEKRG